MTSAVREGFRNWCLLDQKDALESILDILLIRRAVDKTEEQKHLRAAWVQRVSARPDTNSLEAYNAQPPLTVGQLVRVMQLNYEVTDASTLLVGRVHKKLTQKNLALRHASFLSC